MDLNHVAAIMHPIDLCCMMYADFPSCSVTRSATNAFESFRYQNAVYCCHSVQRLNAFHHSLPYTSESRCATHSCLHSTIDAQTVANADITSFYTYIHHLVYAGKSAGMILRQINAEALTDARALHLEQTCDMLQACSLSREGPSAHPTPLPGMPAAGQHHAR